MNIIDRVLAFQKERDDLDYEIHNFARKVAKARGEDVPGTHHYDWDYSPQGATDYWNYQIITDPRPSIKTSWEYADCGSTPYWFPAHWMNLSDEEWMGELKEDRRLLAEAKAEQTKKDAEARREAAEARDRAEYARLQEKFG